VGLVEFPLQGVDRTVSDGDGFAALQAGEVVPVLFHAAVEGFAAGEGAGLDGALEFEGFEGAVDGGEAHGLVAIAEFRVEVLGGDFLVEGFEALEGALLVAGAAGGHGGGLAGDDAGVVFYFRAWVSEALWNKMPTHSWRLGIWSRRQPLWSSQKDEMPLSKDHWCC